MAGRGKDREVRNGNRSARRRNALCALQPAGEAHCWCNPSEQTAPLPGTRSWEQDFPSPVTGAHVEPAAHQPGPGLTPPGLPAAPSAARCIQTRGSRVEDDARYHCPALRRGTDAAAKRIPDLRDSFPASRTHLTHQSRAALVSFVTAMNFRELIDPANDGLGEMGFLGLEACHEGDLQGDSCSAVVANFGSAKGGSGPWGISPLAAAQTRSGLTAAPGSHSEGVWKLPPGRECSSLCSSHQCCLGGIKSNIKPAIYQMDKAEVSSGIFLAPYAGELLCIDCSGGSCFA